MQLIAWRDVSERKQSWVFLQAAGNESSHSTSCASVCRLQEEANSRSHGCSPAEVGVTRYEHFFAVLHFYCRFFSCQNCFTFARNLCTQKYGFSTSFEEKQCLRVCLKVFKTFNLCSWELVYYWLITFNVLCRFTYTFSEKNFLFLQKKYVHSKKRKVQNYFPKQKEV